MRNSVCQHILYIVFIRNSRSYLFKLILNFKALKNWNCRHVFVFNHSEELNKGRRVKWSTVLSERRLLKTAGISTSFLVRNSVSRYILYIVFIRISRSYLFKLILNFKALKNWNCHHVFVFNHFEELNKGRRVKWSTVLSVDFSKPLRCFKV